MKLISIISSVLLLFLSYFGNTQSLSSIITKAAEAKTFCQKHQLDTTFCILIDMSIHSGKNRIFLWDFEKKRAVNSGLCSHGCCDLPWGAEDSKTNPTFSNEHESHCSSLGKYKIGKRGWSNWGININYKLHGLESSNSNAFDRIIVLHSWDFVSEIEIYPNGTPEGWGCPAVSNEMMKKIDIELKQATTPVLLWIYNN